MWFIAFLSSCVEAKKLNTVLLDLSFQKLLRVMVSALGCGFINRFRTGRHNRRKVNPVLPDCVHLPFAPWGSMFLLHLAVGILGAFSVTTFVFIA